MTTPPPPPHGQPGGFGAPHDYTHQGDAQYGQQPYGYAARPVDPSQYGMQQEKPGIWLRFAARLIDSILISIVSLPLYFLIGNPLEFDAGIGSSLAVGVLSAVIYVAYFAIMESQVGATVGKMLLSLRVVGANGDVEDIATAFKRNLWGLASVIPVIGGLVQLGLAIGIAVTASNDPAGRSFMDNFAPATVVKK